MPAAAVLAPRKAACAAEQQQQQQQQEEEGGQEEHPMLRGTKAISAGTAATPHEPLGAVEDDPEQCKQQ